VTPSRTDTSVASVAGVNLNYPVTFFAVAPPASPLDPEVLPAARHCALAPCEHADAAVSASTAAATPTRRA